MLYVKLLKALYGLLRSALIFQDKLRGKLEDLGFIVNPYDPCVAKRLVDISQLTVTWHVNNLKFSHKDAKVVTSFFSDLQKICGDDDLTVKHGKI